MHDPMTQAFSVPRPWPTLVPGSRQVPRWKLLPARRRAAPGSPVEAEAIATGRDPFPWWRPRGWSWSVQLAGRLVWWPPLLTVWHVEPGGEDSGEVCQHMRREQMPDGSWRTRVLHSWRWHVHHWHIQVHPAQRLRRWLLTRCAWCGGRSRRRDAVNVSHEWDGPRGRWWRGEPGLYHMDCSAVERAHQSCLCERPQLEHHTWGRCRNCTRFRGYGTTPGQLVRQQLLASVPLGRRNFATWVRVRALARAEQTRTVST